MANFMETVGAFFACILAGLVTIGTIMMIALFYACSIALPFIMVFCGLKYLLW